MSLSVNQVIIHSFILFLFCFERTTAEVDELEKNISSKLVTIVLPNDHRQADSEEGLTLTVKLDQADDSLIYLPDQQSTI